MRRVVLVGPMTALVGVIALLVGLDAWTVPAGLGVSGWTVGVTCAAGLAALLTVALLRARRRALGPADRVTLTRAGLACGVAAVTASLARTSAPEDARPLVALLAVTTLALVLDAVDGAVARRTGTVTALGARFDMETDAFLLLVLSLHVARDLGPWVLAVGAARYALLVVRVVGRRVTWLRGQVPPRRWRKAVAAYQGIALTVASAQLLPVALVTALVATGVALLVVSFATEVVELRRAAAPAPVGGRSAAPVRRVAGRVLTVLALGLVWVALVAPAPALGWSPSVLSLARLPVEALALGAVLLGLRGGTRRVVELGAGLVLGGLLLVRVLDAAFVATLYRPFNPLTDLRYVESARDLLADATGPVVAGLAVAGAVLLAVALLALTPLAVRRTGSLVRGHRVGTTRTLAVGVVAWIVLAATGIATVGGLPTAASSTAALAAHEVTSVRDGVHDRDVFAAQIPVDPFRGTPPSELLTALRGKDVVVVFVESYGRVAVEDSPEVAAALAAGTTSLAADGWSSRSAWLTSPTFGGISWLAHSTLQSGLWVDSQQRYDQLLDTDRLTLARAFKEAGWRTVDVVPANRRDWPEGRAFYGYDAVLDSRTLGYRGPGYGYAPMPDQYTLSAFDRLELEPSERAPVMAEVDLVTSHVPWAPLPRLVDWHTIGDGSVFAAQAGTAPTRDAVWRSPASIRAAYGQSVAYALASVLSFLHHTSDDDLVVVVLGDHQPAAVVSGDGAGHDVPVSIISRDPAVLDRVVPWRWQPGLRPGDGVAWPMDRFRDRFLTAFGPGGDG